jgi:predicted ATPase
MRVSSSRLIGRTTELTELEAALADAADGRPSLAFVAGESGVGKSRLLAEFERRAAGQGALVLAGDCVDLGESELPYVPLVAALRPLARSHRRMPAQLRTGTAALVGRTAMVTERISNDEGTGSVKLEGESWTARSYDEDDVIEAGRRVQVMEIRGATALVAEE